METIYFLFEPNSNNFATWMQIGFIRGFIILIGISFLSTIVYYLLLGKISSKHSKNSRWLLFMVLNCVFVLVCSLIITNMVIPPMDETAILGFSQDVWVFSLFNGTLYAILFYFIFSLLLNSFSIYSKYIPFNLFKSR